MIKLSGDQTEQDGLMNLPPEEQTEQTSIPAEMQVLVKRFKLSHAPEGICNAGIMVDGDTEQVELINGIFEFPADWDADDVQCWSDALISAGFEDISEYQHVLDVDAIIKKEEENTQKDVVYSLAHPDYFGKEDVTMKIPMPTDEKPDNEVEIQLEQGVFKTEDVEFAEVLKSFGFVDLAQ